MPNSRLLAPALAASLLLSACALQREALLEDADQLSVPPQWDRAATTDADSRWDSPLVSPQLSRLLQQSLERSPALQAARQGWLAAQHQARATGADLVPQISAGASVGRNLNGDLYSNAFDAQLNLSWDLDLWDSLKQSEQIALLDVDNARVNWHSSQLSLRYALLNDWVGALRARARALLWQARIENYQRQIAIIESRLESGLAELADLYSAQATYEASRASLQEANYDLAAAERDLAFQAQSAEFSLSAGLSLPPVPALGADLLEQDLRTQRSDLVLAYNAVAAQDLRLAQALSARLPSLSLSSGLGRSASSSSDLLLSDANFANLALNLSAPLFDYGKRQALAEQARALAHQQLYSYRDSINAAIHEVEELLELDSSLAQRYQARSASLGHWQALMAIYDQQYLAGLREYQSLLDNEQRVFDSALGLADLQYQHWLNRLNLAQALGLVPFPEVRAADDATLAPAL